MSSIPVKPRRIWLRSFYGFGPEEDGYIGWTEEGPRDRMLGLVEDGDLFMIYGASTAETNKSHRNRVLGFLQVEAKAIRDKDKSSKAGMQRKRDNGWQDKWTFAIPVKRAWRADESILLSRIAPDTYRPEAGQAIAVWNPPLSLEEMNRALKIRVTEVNVFGESPISSDGLMKGALAQAFQPSRAFPGSFGERTSNYEDGPTILYLARFEGDGFALRGHSKPQFDKSVLLKIGVSNNLGRRISELNAGFPPAAVGKWSIALKSEPYGNRKEAEVAEQLFKDEANRTMESLGGEFFQGDLTEAQGIFAGIPGVSRFGR
ncbi:GIY-YIG nuclease family protein [Afipia sp. DC4300-2b1]|uniref:GIY-YIG nuclease family protein n=1 Tax=Afipia sp. DC4300-2b1 TaxID=2804672 RepID=UPI003CED6979